MKKSKTVKNKPEKQADVAPVAMHGTEQAEAMPEVMEEVKAAEIAPQNEPSYGQIFGFDCWIYHEDEKPRILKAGDPMPEGWQNHRRFERVTWTVNGHNEWKRTVKE